MVYPAIRPHFFGACPKKRCRAAKEKRFFYLSGSTIRVSATSRWTGRFWPDFCRWLGACRGFVRVRRFLGQKPPPPTADSTPFLCSCAKKRGGAPKKRAYGCRHGRCWVPPASPTDSKPQHHSRLRQADLSARSTHRVQVNLTHQFVPLGLTPNGRGGWAHQGDVEASKRFSLTARHRFFGQAPKKWGRKAGKANDPHPTYRRTRRKPPTPTKPRPKSGEERPVHRPIALTRMVEPPG